MRPVRLLLCGLLGAGLAGCSTVKFYAQAARGQAEILGQARPTGAVLRDPQVPEKVKRKLAVVEEVRHFASAHLALPGRRQYGRYSDLRRRYVSWVVYAAPEFSVEGKTWRYPLVGRLEYRGYFSENAAEEEAARLRAHGWEVYVGGVEAYSTLGWFRDPVLNTFLRRSDPELAELLFHELTHVKVFLPGDTEFNEALATAVAEEGVRRWLSAKGDRRTLARYEAAQAQDREIVQLLLEVRRKLAALYTDKARSAEKMRREKAAAFRQMRAEYARIRAHWRADSHYDRAFAKPWNNARLNTVATYYDLLPGFQRLLREQHGELPAFYAAAAKMRTLTKEERRARLRGG